MNFLGEFFSSLQTGQSSSKGVVGIDIGSSSMKVVELQEKNEVLTLVTYGEVQLGPYAGKQVGESVMLKPKQEQTALVDVIRESAIKSRSAVFAMPLSSSFVTNVTVEAGQDADLAAMVRVEARKVIPASLSEVTLDWAEVEISGRKKRSKDRDILIAAIQNSALERFKKLMQFAGFSEPPTEIECFSMIRGQYDSDDTDVAIIDIGAVSAKLYIAHKGLLMRMYRIRAGGSIATEKIAKSKNIGFQEAEEMKLNASRENSDFADLKRVHDQSYERVFREFNQVLREYEKKNDVSLSNIYLSGGGALFPGIDQYLKESLDRDVSLVNPFSKVAYPAFMEDTMLQIGPSFAVALGAAMRGFE